MKRPRPPDAAPPPAARAARRRGRPPAPRGAGAAAAPIDERRLAAAADAVRARPGRCPAVASLPEGELRALLAAAVRAYLACPPGRARVPARGVRSCYLCGEPVPAGEGSLGRVKPQAGCGGPDGGRAAHRRCNLRKWRASLDEWRAEGPQIPWLGA